VLTSVEEEGSHRQSLGKGIFRPEERVVRDVVGVEIPKGGSLFRGWKRDPDEHVLLGVRLPKDITMTTDLVVVSVGAHNRPVIGA